MDAARLVAEAERSMGRSTQPDDVIAEAWQVYELTEAVARLLREEHGRSAEPERPADHGGSGEDGGGAGEHDRSGAHGAEREPGRTAARGGPVPVVSVTGVGPPRAARLTAVRDPAGTLRALRTLLGEIGLALVGFIAAAADERMYWQCIEALDAVDEAKDRVRALTGAHRE
jgi:hypothetical protein